MAQANARDDGGGGWGFGANCFPTDQWSIPERPTTSTVDHWDYQKPEAISPGNDAVDDGWEVAADDQRTREQIRTKIGLLVNNRWRVTSKIAIGTYGALYAAKDEQKKGAPRVAVKFEVANDRHSSHISHEATVYEDFKGLSSVPRLHWTGREYGYDILVMDLLGPSVAELRLYCHLQYSPYTIRWLAEEMLTAVASLHSRGYIHRDIKPENFLVGLGAEKSDTKKLYVVDFGLSRRFESGGRHVSLRQLKKPVGTLKYASTRNHQNLEPTRRDDIESVAYVLLEILLVQLPWTYSYGTKKRPNATWMMRRKMSTDDWATPESAPIVEWIRYAQRMSPYERPNYERLMELAARLCPNAPSRISRPPPTPSQERTPKFEEETLTRVSESQRRDDDKLERRTHAAMERTLKNADPSDDPQQAPPDEDFAHLEWTAPWAVDDFSAAATTSVTDSNGKAVMRLQSWTRRAHATPNALDTYYASFAWTAPQGYDAAEGRRNMDKDPFAYGRPQ